MTTKKTNKTNKAPNPLLLAQPLRIVLDTNVVMALWHFCDPKLIELKDWLATPHVHPLSNERCLDELQRVLGYEQFKIALERQAQVLADYRARVEVLPVPDETVALELARLPMCRDRDDQKFLELAIFGNANVLLSRDKLVLRLAYRSELRARLQILSPEFFQQFLHASTD